MKDLYESFFKEAFKATSEKMGIVYTPNQVVDYILHATDRLLHKEFGEHLYDKDVHILDAFTGTGTFIVNRDKSEYEVGTEDRLFLSEEDAHKYLEDPSSFSEDYGTVPDYEDLDLPYYTGTTFFYCDANWLDHRWEVFEEYYTYVYFDADGSVRVGDGESECTVIGKEVDPCFDTLRKAQAYMRKNPI